MLDLIPIVAIGAGSFIGGTVAGYAMSRGTIMGLRAELEWAIAERKDVQRECDTASFANATLRTKLRQAVADLIKARSDLAARKATRSAAISAGNRTKAAKRSAAK